MTNKITKSLLVLAASGLMFVGAAAAQQDNTSGAGAGKVDPGHPRVNQVNKREQNQQNRIGNGVKSGQLTPGETRRLERGEQRLQNNEKKDMAKDNGHLTKQDQRQLNHEANHMSKRIYKDKHNAKTN
jgi:CRISPR/Cas system-associated endoribonuclease Cas2